MNYCYMDDVCGEEFKPEEFENSSNFKYRIMNGKPYIDPDSYSKKLYDDLKVFLSKRLSVPTDEIKVYKRNGFYEIKYGDFCLGSDYIGPSTTIIYKKGYSDLDAGNIIKNGRILGGHILWPRRTKSSINTRRAYCFKDRFDATLLDLKKWYEGNDCMLKDTFDDNASWLRPHPNFGFKDFVELFVLEDFVEPETSMPYNLSTYDWSSHRMGILYTNNRGFTDNQYYYDRYIEGNIYAIKCREKRIRKIMEDAENGTI